LGARKHVWPGININSMVPQRFSPGTNGQEGPAEEPSDPGSLGH